MSTPGNGGSVVRSRIPVPSSVNNLPRTKKEEKKFTYNLDSSKMDLNTKRNINNYINYTIWTYWLFFVYMIAFAIFFWYLSGSEDHLGWSSNSNDSLYGWYLCGWIFGGICFVIAMFIIGYYAVYKRYIKNDVESALNLMDTMSNLYSNSLANKDLSTSMANILKPVEGSESEIRDNYRDIQTHFKQFDNKVARSIVKNLSTSLV